LFEKEFNFFVANQGSLVERFGGKTLVIQGETVIGVYDTPLQAYLESQKQHAIGTFMIQSCEPGPEAYTVTLT
jgi:hypothetical protein